MTKALTSYRGLPDFFVLNQMEEMTRNSLLARSQFIDKLLDQRRDIDAECDYPTGEFLNINIYRALYAREGVAERVVNVWPLESWQVQPTVFEDDDEKVTTAFEKAWDEVGKNLLGQQSYFDPAGGGETPNANPVWSWLCRADVLSGIGTFGVILLGINDGKLLEQPADGVTPDGYPSSVKPVGEATVERPAPDTKQPIPAKTNPSNNPAQVVTPASLPADKQFEPADALSKDIYGGQLPQDELTSTMGTDAQYYATQFTPTSWTNNPISPMNPKSPAQADQPPGSKQKPKAELLFLRCFDETLVQVVQYEADIRNPRFGQPLMYLITLNDPNQPHTGVGLPLASVRVHWSRVIHLADNLRNSEIFGVPRMQPVLNRLLDLRKLYAGSAEMYWKGAFPGLSLETNPTLGGDVIVDTPGLQSMMYSYMNGLQRYLTLMGMSAKTLSPQVVDPSAQVDKQVEAVCIELKIPVRVFKGSERGELASSQDDSTWNDRVRHRQLIYVTPKVIVPFIDRLIALKILPTPKRYCIEWPDMDAQTDAQKAQILLQRTQAYAAYVSGNLQSIIQPLDYMTKFDDMDGEQAQEVTKEAEDKQEEEKDDAQALADQHGFVPQPPEGFTHPPAPPPKEPPPSPIKLKDGESLYMPGQQGQDGGPPNQPPAQGPPGQTQPPPGKPRPPFQKKPAANMEWQPTDLLDTDVLGRSLSYDVLGRRLVIHSDPGHAGRPGQRGGSAPGKGEGGLKTAGGESERKGASPEEMKSAFRSWTRKHEEEKASERFGPKEGGELGKENKEEEEGPLGSHTIHVIHTAGHVREIVEALPKVAEKTLGSFAGSGVARAGLEAGVVRAGTAERVGHVVADLHKHVSAVEQAHEGGEQLAEGHGGEAEGKHEAINHFVEASGAVLGSKFASGVNKGLGIDKKAEELYKKMEEEHGAAAPWLHAAATVTALGVKTFLTHALAGPAGFIASGVGEHVFSHLAEATIEAATEGIKGFSGFALTPGLSYAALLAAHGFGKVMNKTGITDSRLAHRAAAVQHAIGRSRPYQMAKSAIHKGGEYLEKFENLPPFKAAHAAGEVIGKGIGKTAKTAIGAGKWTYTKLKQGGHMLERLHEPGAPSTVQEGLRASRHPLPLVNANTVTGKQPMPALSLDNPAVQMYVQLLRHTILALMKTPLWDKLNSPEGLQLVKGLLTAGTPAYEPSAQEEQS